MMSENNKASVIMYRILIKIVKKLQESMVVPRELSSHGWVMEPCVKKFQTSLKVLNHQVWLSKPLVPAPIATRARPKWNGSLSYTG